MTRLTFFILLLLSLQVNAANLTSVARDTTPLDLRADYEIESRKELNGAIVMVCMGAVSMTVGIVGYLSIAADELYANRVFRNRSHTSQDGTGYVVAIIAGGLFTLISIALFVDSGKNKKLARSAPKVSFNIESANKLQTGGFSKTYFPGIKLTLRF
jgi:hypothetical protein